MKTRTLGFIGGGKMAEAMLAAFLGKQLVSKETTLVSDCNAERLTYLANHYSIRTTTDNAQVPQQCDIVFLATKPQDLVGALKNIRDSFSSRHLVISIAAGITIGYLEDQLPDSRIVRVMPNIPILVGEMAAGYALGSRATSDDADRVSRLLDSAGDCVALPEPQLDAVTGLSGSGPAFVAAFIKALSAAGAAQGLNPKVALRLALQTVLGTARLLRDKPILPEELITMVSSPNGTTMAGRNVLEASDFDKIMQDTIAAATRRSKALAKG